MTPLVAAHQVAVWVTTGEVGHRRVGVRTGCQEYSILDAYRVPIDDTERHGVRPCRERRCFPNGFGRQYRAVA